MTSDHDIIQRDTFFIVGDDSTHMQDFAVTVEVFCIHTLHLLAVSCHDMFLGTCLHMKL